MKSEQKVRPKNRRHVVVTFGGRKDKVDPEILGGKGKSLAAMQSLGFPVPPGFTIATSVARAYAEHGRFPKRFDGQLEREIAALEKSTGKRFGDPEHPLLVSVRSGAPVSMPGMMDTILNLGLTENIKNAMHKRGEGSFASDIAERFAGCWQETVGGEIPDDPIEQLRQAIAAVMRSWDNPRAKLYRKEHGISESMGTGVNVQLMVFGNRDQSSGTGVVFSHDPVSGRHGLTGEFLSQAQGEALVRGLSTPEPISRFGEVYEAQYQELAKGVELLARHEKSIVEVEFTLESGKLWFLQYRVARVQSPAKAAVLVREVWEKRLSKEDAVTAMGDELEQHANANREEFVPEALASATLIAEGTAVSPGVAAGQVVYTSEEAIALAKAGRTVILVRPDTNPNDLAGMLAASAIITEVGGATSHAAVVARQIGKPCVVGTSWLRHDQAVSVDGETGKIYAGVLSTHKVGGEPSKEISLLFRWRQYNFPTPRIDESYLNISVSIHSILADVYMTELMEREAKGTRFSLRAQQLRKDTHVRVAEHFATYLVVACASEIEGYGPFASGTIREEDAKTFQKYFLGSRSHETKQYYVRRAVDDPQAYFKFAKHLFVDYKWRDACGGRKWAKIAETAELFFQGKINHSVFVDAVFDLQHNNGHVFDKMYCFDYESTRLELQLDAKKNAKNLCALAERWGTSTPSPRYLWGVDYTPRPTHTVEELFDEGMLHNIWRK